MNLLDRLKKEMSEGVVKALLEDAHYRVIESGIEKVIRELSVLNSYEYKLLHFPDAIVLLPDFTVMNKSSDEKKLVEVKYRTNWDPSLLDDVKRQVELFGEIVLVCFNGNPTDARDYTGPPDAPSRHLRCCRLKIDAGVYSIYARNSNEKSWQWKTVKEFASGSNPWWGLTPLQEEFNNLADIDRVGSVKTAMKALSGLL